jgi:hypothetical protein
MSVMRHPTFILIIHSIGLKLYIEILQRFDQYPLLIVVLNGELGNLFTVSLEKNKVLLDCFIYLKEWTKARSLCQLLLRNHRDHWDLWTLFITCVKNDASNSLIE